MADWKLLTYSAGGPPRAGLLCGERVVDAAEILGLEGVTTLDLLRRWDEALPRLGRAAASAGGGRNLAGLRLEAPILFPGTYFCAAANYYDHAREMNPAQDFRKEGKQPYFFVKPGVSTTVGPHDPIRLPRVAQQIDWEIELGVVIGRPARNLTAAAAMSCVAGYTIVNDLSARDLGRRADWPMFHMDWLGQKVFDGAMPMGPWIVPADHITDPSALTLKLWRNGELMQNSAAGQMIFGIAEQIEYLSRRVTLQPGDVIATGTPAGVGKPRGVFLKPGDRVRLEIGGIGAMEARVEAGD